MRRRCASPKTTIWSTHSRRILHGMGLMHMAKNEKAKKELADKGMALE